MHRKILALMLTTAFALAGCAALPQKGPVAEGNVDLVESNPLYLQVYGPVADSSPEQIVRGFLAAQAGGAEDNFETARKFLSPQARDAWNPNSQITVFSGELPLEQVETSDPTDGEDGEAPAATDADGDDEGATGAEPASVTWSGQVEVNGTLDSDGRYTEATAGATQDVSFTLVKDSTEQWRISQTGNGVLILEPNFLAGYRAADLYFLTSDGEYLVPETRWFPQRNFETYVTKALVSGPSTWLRDAVITGFPVGTRLAIDAVAIDASGVAAVELTAAVLDAKPDARAQLIAQLNATLTRLPGVSTVQVLVNGDPLPVASTITPVRDPMPLTVPIGIRDRQIVQMNGRSITPVTGVSELGNQRVTGLAFGEGLTPLVIRNRRSSLELVPSPGGMFVTVMHGTNLLSPSVDRFGWIWSASADRTGELRTVKPAVGEVTVGADWLEGLTPLSLKVSRDGARVALISNGPNGIQIDVAGIVRDRSGTPHGLSTPVSVGASLTTATDLTWVDESTLAVLGQSSSANPVTVHMVPIGAHSSALTSVDGAVSITSGRGQRTLYVESDDGALWTRTSTGTNWSRVATDLDFFTFSG